MAERGYWRFHLSVHVLSISDGDDQDDKSVIMDLVKHSVIPDADTPSRAAGKFLTARRSGVRTQLTDGVDDAGLCLSVEPGELFLRRSQNLDRVSHLP